MKLYPEHETSGDPCLRCFLPAAQHRPRSKAKAATRAKHVARFKKRAPSESFTSRPIVVLDGEGLTIGREHLFVYMAAVDEAGCLIGECENLKKGLNTSSALAFLTSLSRVIHPVAESPSLSAFIFSGGYDLSKILEELPDRALWLLARPEERKGNRDKARAVIHKTRSGTYAMHYQRGRFSVQKIERRELTKKGQSRIVGPRLILWDCFSFFSSSLVKALKAWGIGSVEELAAIESMKEQRGAFQPRQFARIKKYCQDECRLTAKLVRKLITAHELGGLTLKSYYGAGSSGSAMLDRWGAKRWLAAPPWEMRRAIAQAYSGGRFEVAQIGKIEGKVYGYDVSSAYPYAQSQGMPCMMHGRWEHVDKHVAKAIERAPYALVKSAVLEPPQRAWGPFQWRNVRGEITYPLTSAGTWTWRAEYEAARRAPHCWCVRPLEAWVYQSECDCDPFGEVASMYRLRVEVGKDGPGLAIKLGINANYGKLCQSIGAPPYQCWTWAGMVTSHCRAQLLDAIAAAGDPWDVFQVATDGVFSRTPLVLPIPENTCTGEITETATRKIIRKPLGGWETKEYTDGMFVVRPGCYFPLGAADHQPVEDNERVRARGVGRKHMSSHRDRIVKHYEAWDRTLLPFPLDYRFDELTVFVGFRAGIRGLPIKGQMTREAGDPVRVARSDDYGTWIKRDQILSFSPIPKRSTLNDISCRLEPWEVGEGDQQVPYPPAIGGSELVSIDAKALRNAEDELLDQPDGEPELPWGV